MREYFLKFNIFIFYLKISIILFFGFSASIFPEVNKEVKNQTTINSLLKGHTEIRESISVLGKAKTIRVLYKQDVNSEICAKQIMNLSKIYISSISEYLGIAPSMDTFTLTDIDVKDARNDGYSVFTPFQFPDENHCLATPLLYHEIGHWWFGQDPRWISEGVSSFIPIAMAESGFLQLSHDDRMLIFSWWGLRNELHIHDFPLGDNGNINIPKDSVFPNWYEKSFRIQYVLLRELGSKSYREYLKSMFNYDPIYPSDPYFINKSEEYLQGKSKGIINLLNKQKRRPWNIYLSGWLLSPRYLGLKPSELLDDDHDGLMNFEEKILGTHPSKKDTDGDGVSDGLEIIYNTDPLKKDSQSLFYSKVEQFGIILDGNEDDWKFSKDVKVVSTQSNLKIPGKYDMVEFKYIIRDDFLYGMIKTREPIRWNPIQDKGVYFFIADNSDTKERTGLGSWYHPNPFLGWEYQRIKGKPEQFFAKLGDVFEFKISIKNFPDRKMKITPLINPPKGDSLGIWNEYKPIEIDLR
jgi:hypothetical protein